MSRTPSPPRTSLGQALRARRAPLSQARGAQAAELPRQTLSRIEAGTHRPSADTAVKLARWLGWSVERVLLAADQRDAVRQRLTYEEEVRLMESFGDLLARQSLGVLADQDEP